LQQPERAGDRAERTPPARAAPSPETLMIAYQRGDTAAATALIRRVSPLLYRLFLADAASRAQAEDLLQETWLRIHRIRHTYRPGAPVMPWAYAIARHIRIDHYRRSSRISAREQSLDYEAVAPVAEPARLEELDALLAPLPAAQREVIEMLKLAGMSLEEVARATSSTVGSVKQKAHRAYRRLRARFKGAPQ
jgi:RNA polymerase sigma-70 factor, ECF subfamily